MYLHNVVMVDLLFVQCNDGKRRQVRKRPERGVREVGRGGRRRRKRIRERRRGHELTLRRNHASLNLDKTRFLCKYA